MSTDPFDVGADVHFSGEVDWRKELADEVDPDDEELAETPRDVVDILGFDPKDLDDSDDDQ